MSESIPNTDKPMSRRSLTLIVAATPKNGIGKDNGLPWPMLKKEMAYFARITKRIPTGMTGRNAVIMGRKTWESIPPKFRPLKDRTNVVISSQDRSKLGDIPAEVIVASDILSALNKLKNSADGDSSAAIGRAFVIGGASIYNAALDLPQADSILLTRIHKDFNCDTFFPDIDGGDSGWREQSLADLQEFVGEEVSSEPLSEGEGDGLTKFSFHLYQRR